MVPPSDAYGSFLWNIGYSLCHQISERSFQIGGMQLPVCARDTGTFIAFFVVIFLFLGLGRFRMGKLPDKVIIIVAVIGMAFYAFDALSSYLGFRETSNEIRLLSGLAFGSGMALLLTSVASVAVFRSEARQRTFTFRDLPSVYLFMGLLALPMFIDGGAVMYYIEATIIITGYILMIFTVMLILTVTLTGWDMTKRIGMSRGLPSAAVLTVVALLVLWAAHHLTSMTIT
jgi:uncharacterized membrane protein